MSLQHRLLKKLERNTGKNKPMKLQPVLAVLIGLSITSLAADPEKLEDLVSKEEAAAIAAEAEKSKNTPSSDKSPENSKPLNDQSASEKAQEEQEEKEKAEQEEVDKENNQSFSRSYRQFKDYRPSNQISDRPSVRLLGNTNEKSRPLK